MFIQNKTVPRMGPFYFQLHLLSRYWTLLIIELNFKNVFEHVHQGITDFLLENRKLYVYVF